MDPSLLNLSPLPARAGRGGATSCAEVGSGAGTGATFAGLLSSSMIGAATAQTALPADPEAAGRSLSAAGEGVAPELGGLSLSALLRLRMNAAAGRETVSARAVLAEAGTGAEAVSGDRLAALLASSETPSGGDAPGGFEVDESAPDEAGAPLRMEHGLPPHAPELQLPMMPDPAAVPAPGLTPLPPSEMALPQSIEVSAGPVSSSVGTGEPARLQRGAGAMPGATAVPEATVPDADPAADFRAALPPAGRAPERRLPDSMPVADAARAAAAGAGASSEVRPALAALGETAFSRQSGRTVRSVEESQARASSPILSSDRLSSEAALAADRALQASLRLQAAAQVGMSRTSAGSAAETQAATAAVVAAGSPMLAQADPARAEPKGGVGSPTDRRMPNVPSPGAGLEALRAGANAPNDRAELATRLDPAGSAEDWAGALAQAQAQATVPVQGPASAAPAVVAESRVETPFGHPDFADEMVAHVAQHASLSRHGLREVTLHLNPVEMGPVSVRIAIEGSVASVDFAATQAATRQQLEQSLPLAPGQLLQQGGEGAPIRWPAVRADPAARAPSRRVGPVMPAASRPRPARAAVLSSTCPKGGHDLPIRSSQHRSASRRHAPAASTCLPEPSGRVGSIAGFAALFRSSPWAPFSNNRPYPDAPRAGGSTSRRRTCRLRQRARNNPLPRRIPRSSSSSSAWSWSCCWAVAVPAS